MKSLVESILNESTSSDYKGLLKDLKKDSLYKKLTGNCELWVDKYDRGGGEFCIMKFDANDKLQALKKLTEYAQLYILGSELKIKGDHYVYDDDELTFDELIDRIMSENGDGCDFIHYFSFKDEAIIDEIDKYHVKDLVENDMVEFVQR